MKVCITKRNAIRYYAYSPEINDIIYNGGDPDGYIISKYTGVECSGLNAGQAIAEFNEFLKEFIEYYVEVMGCIPQPIMNYNIEYEFDKASFENYWLKPTPKVSKTYNSFPGHEQLSGDILIQDLDHADPNNPFFDKKVVFTGVLQTMSRTEAASLVKAKGADINTSISKATNIVILGVDAGPAKMEKIEALQSAGNDIKIVTEDEFLVLLGR